MSDNKYNQKMNINTNNKKKYIKYFLILILFLILGICSVCALTINNYLNKINKITSDDNNNIQSNINLESEDLLNSSDSHIENTIPRNTDIKNLAIFGIDGTDGELCRSDCIMILTIDNIHDKIKLSSIIRDSYVNIPTKQKKDKINHAYAFGGPSLAVETLNKNFDIDISKFVSVNFSSFPKIIDSVGGISLYLTDDETKYINQYINQINSLNGTSSPNIKNSGSQPIDGTQALAYSRIRYTEGGDFERSHRQRIVIEHIFEKLKTLSLKDYPNILNELLPLINTNLSNKEILSICMDINALKSNGITQARFPENEDAEGKLINEVYYYVFDENATKNKIHKFIYN